MTVLSSRHPHSCHLDTPTPVISTEVERSLNISMMIRDYFVYIMASPSGTFYVGMTNDLNKRVFEHKNKTIPGFTARYGCSKLVYFEVGQDVRAVIEREKQIKKWNRRKKEALIKKMNPTWKDLSESN